MSNVRVPKPEEIRAALIDAAAAVSLALPVTELLNATEVAGGEEPWKTLLPGENCRAVCCGLVGDVFGVIALALSADLAETVVNNGDGSEEYAEMLVPVISEAIASIATIITADVVPETPYEFMPADAFKRMPSGLQFSSIELFDGDDHVATLATILGKKNAELPFPERLEDSLGVTVDDADGVDLDVADGDDLDMAAPAAASGGGGGGGGQMPAGMGAAMSAGSADFEPFAAGADMAARVRHPIDLLSEVEMQVTAELGRARLTVGELLSLTPGVIVELNRSASAPIDLLVNGKLIARGEVVVIDEEFGIRISEVVGLGDAAQPQSA